MDPQLVNDESIAPLMIGGILSWTLLHIYEGMHSLSERMLQFAIHGLVFVQVRRVESKI